MIRKDFADLYSLSPDHLENEEKVHCLELLDTHSAHDHSLALRFLEDSTPGIALAASLYLEKTGTLDRMMKESTESDIDDLKRKLKILKTASDHQITSFLDKRENFKHHGSFYIAVKILNSGIPCSQFSWIIQNILSFDDKTAFSEDLKKGALTCLLRRKDTESFALIKETLDDQKTREDHRTILLENLPSAGAGQFYPVLNKFLRDTGFSQFQRLLSAFRKIPLSLCLSDLYTLVRNTGEDREIRKRAILLLSQYKEFSSTLFLIENLFLLNIDEMSNLGTEVFLNNKEHFLYAAGRIFEECDSSLHQKLMHLCSLTGIRDFLPVIEEKLTDSDPESRIRAVWSLRTLNAVESLPALRLLLHDPVQKVRAQTAGALIDWNKSETFQDMIMILNDGHESFSVQESIIDSLGVSGNPKSIEILVSLLESNPVLNEQILASLLHKKSESDIEIIIKLYDSAVPAVKSLLNELFKEMGESVESVLMELLNKTGDLHTSRNISSVLDSTGYVESLIGVLKSASAAKRLDAAEKLSMIGTVKASRGLLYAARDINKNIRILSLKALVRIQQNTEVLTLLENDPDKKVRRYAAWAKERIKAEQLP